MKHLILCLFLVLTVVKASGQNAQDSTLNSYIKIKGYVLFTDTAHLSSAIMPYYSQLKAYLSTNKMYELKDIYIKSPMNIRHLFKDKEPEMELLLSVIDIKGIKILMDLEARQPNPKDTTMNGKALSILSSTWVGDPTGREYSVTINKKTGIITSGRAQ